MELFVTIVNTSKGFLRVALIYRLFWVDANIEVFYFHMTFVRERRKLAEPYLTPSPLAAKTRDKNYLSTIPKLTFPIKTMLKLLNIFIFWRTVRPQFRSWLQGITSSCNFKYLHFQQIKTRCFVSSTVYTHRLQNFNRKMTVEITPTSLMKITGLEVLIIAWFSTRLLCVFTILVRKHILFIK